MDLQLIVVICFELLFIFYAVFNALLICIYLDKSTSVDLMKWRLITTYKLKLLVIISIKENLINSNQLIIACML